MPLSRTLITGGAGFIGAHLAAALIGRGCEVHVAARPQNLLDRFNAMGAAPVVHRLDMSETDKLQRCLRAVMPHHIVHLATDTARSKRHGKADAASIDTNDADILVMLLEMAAALPQPPQTFVRSGTIAEYGAENTLPFREDEECKPSTAYGAAMLECTEIARRMARSTPFPIRTARLGHSYGLYQSDAFLIPALISACLERRPIHVHNPDDSRDLTCIDDVVAGLSALMAAAPTQALDIVNLSRGEAVTMRETATIIADAAGMDIETISFGRHPFTSPSRQCASPMLAEKALGWRAGTDAQAGLRRLVAQTARHMTGRQPISLTATQENSSAPPC